MASWFLTQTTTIRVRQEGKGVSQMTVDLDNPLKSLEELEHKVGVTCPEERKRELLEKLHPISSSSLPAWLQSVTIPEWYKTADPSDVTNALQWGHEIVQEQKRMSETKLHDQLDLNWKRVVEQTREEYAKREQEYERQREHLEQEVQRWRQSAIETVNGTGLERKLQAARQEWVGEQTKILESVERERQSLHQHLSSLQTQLTRAEEARKSLQEKLDQKATNELHLTKSVHKGDMGEEMVDGWLRTSFLGATIRDTSKETGKMDLQMDWDGMNILIDVKNHDGKLHSVKDIQKFYDDIRSNPDVPIAILLCTKTRVQHHDRYWVETEVINDNQIAVFMNNVSQNPIERLQLVAGTVIQPWRHYLRLRQDMSALLAGDELKTWADQARQVLVHGWVLMMKLQDQWAKTQGTITASMKEFQSLLLESAQEIQAEMDAIHVTVDVPQKKGRKKN